MMKKIKEINIDQAVDNSNVLAEIGGSRRCYVVLYHKDIANRSKLSMGSLKFTANAEELILNSETSMQNFSFDELPSDRLLQLVDEIIVPKGMVLDNPLMHSRFKLVEGENFDIWAQKTLNPETLQVFKMTKGLQSLLSTITEPGWEQWHKCHYYPEHKLVLRVLWDRREIMGAWIIDQDAHDVLIQSGHDDDSLTRYSCHEEYMDVCSKIHSEIDFVITKDKPNL